MGQVNLLAYPKSLGPSHVHGDSVSMELRLDHPGARFKTDPIFHTGEPLDKTGKTTRPIAAHLGRPAVTVEEVPRPVSLPGRTGHEQKQPIRPDPPVAITQPGDLLPAQLNVALTIIDEDEIVARTVHFGELQQHEPEITQRGSKRQAIDRWQPE